MIYNQDIKQLNPFEIKAEIIKLFSKYNESASLVSCDVNLKLLDAQQDKKTIIKLLFKELTILQSGDGEFIRFLLERYCEKDELISQLWSILNGNLISNNVKLIILNFLRELDTNWSYEKFGEAVEGSDLIDADTQRLLTSAIVNPEVQIDFLDFLNSLQSDDKITLINSLGEDYTGDELANILIPVFLSQPENEAGNHALTLLGDSKSQLAFHALNNAYEFMSDKMRPIVNKNISKLKMAGIRTDNSHEFYKKILSVSKPYRFCATYPDGCGNSALIFSRINAEEKIQFVAIVINDYTGIRDCFGFNEITKFECDTIIDRFYKNEKTLNIKPEALKTILNKSEKLSRENLANRSIPYEYICWKNLISDIKEETGNITDILEKDLNKRKFSNDEFEEFLDSEVTSHWFFDKNYSDEYEKFINETNTALKNNAQNTNLNNLVNSNIYNIFDKIEAEVWKNRLLTCAYLLKLTGDKHLAEVTFNIYYNNEYLEKLFKYIIKRSIYEYYFELKYNTDNSCFTNEELENIVKKIETEWVN